MIQRYEYYDQDEEATHYYTLEDSRLSLAISTDDEDTEPDMPDDLDCAKASLKHRLYLLQKEAAELEAFTALLDGATEFQPGWHY